MSFSRVAAIGGFIVVILVIVTAVLLGDQPVLDDPIEDVVEYLSEDADMHRASLVVSALLVPFFVVFVAGIVSKVRNSDREHGEAWAIAALAGAILLFATGGLGDALTGVLFLCGGEGLDESTVRAIYDGSFIAYTSMGIALAALTTSVAVPAIRYRFWPAWYGWLSALAAAIGFVSVAAVQWTSTTGAAFGFGWFIALLVWMLATSVLLYRDGNGAAS